MADDVVTRILEQYPGLRPLLGDPEIGPLLVSAVDPNAGFSQQTFEAKLHETYWWKTTPAPAREAMMLGATDPATYALNVGVGFGNLQDWAQKMGVVMTNDEKQFISANWLNAGLNVNDPSAQNVLNAWLKANPDRAVAGGAVQAAAARLEALARSQWFVVPERYGLMNSAIDLAMGKITEADNQAGAMRWVSGFYPHLKDRFEAGETLADIVNPYRDMVAKELELGSLEEVDMVNSSQWKWLTGMPQPDGTMRLPTQQEVLEAARSDQRWWATSNGRRADAGMTRTLLEAFGKVA